MGMVSPLRFKIEEVPHMTSLNSPLEASFERGNSRLSNAHES